MNANTRNAFLLALVVIAAIGVAVVFLSRNKASGGTPTDAGAPTKVVKYTLQGKETQVSLTKVSSNADAGATFVMGKADAPATVVEFSDYECPYCGVYALSIEPQFKTEFVDTGKVKYAVRDFPLSQHANAVPAAIAARCAADQGRWQQMHDIIFRSQQLWSSFSPDAFRTQAKDFARQLGLDETAFDTCQNSEKHTDAIQKDHDAGQAINLQGTPTFVINGYRMDDAPNIDNLRAVLASFGVK